MVKMLPKQLCGTNANVAKAYQGINSVLVVITLKL